MTAITRAAEHTAHRPPGPVRLLNSLGRRADHLGPLGRLDADEMLRDARRRTGLSDLGPDTDEAYPRLIDALNTEGRLTTLGRLVLARMLRSFLAQRLRVVEAHRRLPELSAARVHRPLFVVGYWRTGTTLLHNLLSQADGARPLLGYEASDPVPPALGGGIAGWGPDMRGPRYDLTLRGMYYLAPDLSSIHDEGTHQPTECLQLLCRSFATLHYPSMVNVPSYERWLWEQEVETFDAVFALHRMQLQTLQADGRPGYWVLKSPAHLGTLAALLKAYPDAAVIQTHRDPAKVLGSLSSLVARGIGLLAEEPEPRTVGRQVLERTERTLDQVERTRAQVGGDRILDVRYADLLRDPVAVVGAIHDHFGYPLSAASESRMHRWLADNPKGKHGAHRYSLEQFGLDRGAVERFAAPYRDRFGVPPEPPGA